MTTKYISFHGFWTSAFQPYKLYDITRIGVTVAGPNMATTKTAVNNIYPGKPETVYMYIYAKHW